MSQSLETSGGATIGRPLVMKGSFFSTKLYGHHQVSELNMSEHFLGSNKAFEIWANSGPAPLIMRSNTNLQDDLFKLLEEKERKIKLLGLELSMMKGKARQNKKTVREDYNWSGEEIDFSESINNFCKSFLFPRYEFLKEGWQEYLPDKRNSLYSLCMRHLKIPEGADEDDIWERVIVLSIKMKYINIKGNMNNDLKKIYQSMENLFG
jgi:hypothetical protein